MTATRWILVFVLFVLIVYFLSCPKSTESERNSAPSSAINTLLRQSARYSAAARQDHNPVIANLHANYGAAYLWALQDIASNQSIEQTTGVDLLRYKRIIQQIQDQSTRRLFAACSTLVPQDYVGRVAIGE